MEKIRTLFLGTSEFAVPILTRLVEMEGFDLVGVVTQPDRAVGRHHSEMQATPVGRWLAGYGFQFAGFKPERLRDKAEEILEETKPELIIVAAYGQMIPKMMLDYPKYGCLNVHGSLLPKLRGAVPVQMAILNGFEETGVTLQKMVKKLDAGDVIAKSEYRISKSETSESLMQRLAELGADLIEETLPNWIAGEVEVEPQNEAEATYCHQSDISKDKAQILPDTPANLAERMVRAFNPWPVAWGIVDVRGVAKRLKIYEAHNIERKTYDDLKSQMVNSKSQTDSESKVLKITKYGMKVFLILPGGALELLEIQLEGKKRAPAQEYLYLVS